MRKSNKAIKIGERSASLVVIGRIGEKTIGSGRKFVLWQARCDCGDERLYSSQTFRHRKTCPKCSSARGALLRTKHGQSKKKKNGGKTLLYGVWQGMRGRCSNPKSTAFKWYGAKGIKVCKEWDESFQVFSDWAHANGYKKGMAIDREKSYLDYEPSNCRWITKSESSKEMRDRHILVLLNEFDAFHKGIITNGIWES